MKVQDCAAANAGAGLWKGLGMWAWLLFRSSGLILVACLFVHICILVCADMGLTLMSVKRPMSLQPLY